MKWLSNRYTYPLVAFTIAICYLFQAMWIVQLYRAQRLEVRKDLETLVSESTAMSTYLSVASDHEQSGNLRGFFLSPEWVRFQSAFNDMRFSPAGLRYNSHVANDSTYLTFEFSLPLRDSIRQQPHPIVGASAGDVSLTRLMGIDKQDQHRLDSMLTQKFRSLKMPVKWVSFTRSYDEMVPDSLLKNQAESDGFYSGFYSYNFRFLNVYQVVVPSLRMLVLYRIRYYIISSMLLVLLSVLMLLILVRLVRNQRLYAQARIAFTSNMTHELKTPVSTISLALESIIENNLHNDPATLSSYIAIGQSELNRLNEMIDKVLQLDQFDSGKSSLRPQLLDVGETLNEVVESMRLQLDNAAAVVNVKLPEDPVFVNADPVHLTSVFRNLVENALKFCPPPVRIDIACLVEDGGASIGFQDNGPGIEALYQKRVFDRFFRVPSSSENVADTKGTGLGLNYVKQVIEQHGGKIKLKSEPGKGSQFIIWLPIAT